MTDYAGTSSTKDTSTLRDDVDKTASIRILDPNIVSPTFQQLQQIRNYYTFPPNNLDVDRYPPAKDGTVQDTVVGLRELNLAGIPKKNWINNHFRYTHGFGVVAAKGTAADNGEPVFTESDLPPSGDLGTYQQRVYYGEKTTTYSIVGGPQKEIDYSDNDGEKTTSYRGGKSGVSCPARSTGPPTHWRSASRRSSTPVPSATARGSCTTARPRSASRRWRPG